MGQEQGWGQRPEPPPTSLLAWPLPSSEVPQWLSGVLSMKCVAFFSAWQLMSRRVMFTTSLMGWEKSTRRSPASWGQPRASHPEQDATPPPAPGDAGGHRGPPTALTSRWDLAMTISMVSSVHFQGWSMNSSMWGSETAVGAGGVGVAGALLTTSVGWGDGGEGG